MSVTMTISSNRRHFLGSALALAAAAWPFSRALGAPTKTTQSEPQGFFTLGRRKDHWWFITPNGKPFFSLGVNHIDPATMRYPENIHLWREKYDGSTLKWIKESVAPNLKSWGFNSVGWVQEVTVRQWRHSRAFTYEEYQALDMPYCHLLPFTESHQWEQHTRHYDFRSAEWAEWCDYVARSHCAEFRDDPNLIGYFYSDCPCWIHSRPVNAWRGPMFDPELLKTESGRKELTELAHRYYKTTHDAIRRHDPHHLILGDRYEANAPIAMEVIEAALPYIVGSFLFVEQAVPTGTVALVSAAKMKADAARVLKQLGDRLGVPAALVSSELARLRHPLHSGGIRQQYRFSRLLVPLVEVLDGIAKILE